MKKIFYVDIAAIVLPIVCIAFIVMFYDKCPSDMPLYTLDRDCRRCDERYHVFTKTEEACNVCSNRKATPSVQKDDFNCVIETCPADKPLKTGDWNAGCIACDGHLKDSDMTLWRIRVDTEADCLVCPNREVVKSENKIYCDLPSTCPLDKPMRLNNTGTCTSCDDPNEIDSMPETECLKCPELREWVPDRECKFKKSPDPNRPLIVFEGSAVSFESCDTLRGYVFTTKENCDLCPNREYKDGQCTLKGSS